MFRSFFCFLNFIEVRARYFGGLIGATFGEPYFTNGPLALDHLPGIGRPRPDPGRLPPYRPYL